MERMKVLRMMTCAPCRARMHEEVSVERADVGEDDWKRAAVIRLVAWSAPLMDVVLNNPDEEERCMRTLIVGARALAVLELLVGEAAWSYVLAERNKQVDVKGWTAAHDAAHTWHTWGLVIAHELADLCMVVSNTGQVGSTAVGLKKVVAVCVACLEAMGDGCQQMKEWGAEGA